MATTTNPKWWTNEHTGAWERVKEALHRDWEQTKSDFSKTKGKDLNQNVADTVKQAAGKEPVPPPNVQTRPDKEKADRDWDHVEPAMRYGYGARQHYSSDHMDWDDRLENKLKTEWNDLRTGRTWDEAKSFVRRGWDSGSGRPRH